MKKEEKIVIIDRLAELLQNTPHFYVADVSTLNAEMTTSLRRSCFDSKVTLMVVKNTLLQKALEKISFPEVDMYKVFAGPTALMLCEVANAPAKVIKAFRAKSEKPVLKAAYVQESLYVGDSCLEELVNIKSRNELIADVVALLQSPAKNVISALQAAAGQKVAGLVKSLEERAA
jgi:large subunit ribosomal protein L10